MALKPVDRRRPLESREAIWKLIRAMRTFTMRDLWEELRLSKASIQDYLMGLARAGYLGIEQIPGRGGLPVNRYTLTKDPGPEPPRVRRDGTEVTQGRGRIQMWRAMKVLGTFTVRDLVVHAATEEHQVAMGEARTYCQFLAKAGYLVKRGDAYVFQRQKYTGPRPPMIQRIKQVFDPNLNQVVWSQGGDDE